MRFHDVELLSAYLDRQLDASESARLEARLAREPELERVLADLRAARGVLRALPRRKAPRDFILRPQMKKLAAPTPPAFPLLRFASVVASVLFLATLAVNGLTPLASSQLAAAAAPAYGMGGGGPPEEQAAPAAPAASPEPPRAAPSTPAPGPIQTAPDLQAQAQKTAPQLQTVPPPSAPVIPIGWQLILAGLAAALGLGAWYLKLESASRFRRRWSAK